MLHIYRMVVLKVFSFNLDELNTLDRLKLLSRTISEKRKIADNLQYKKVVAKKTLKERLRETEIKLQKELDSVNDVIVKTEIDIESINLIPDEIDSLSVFISPDTKSLVEKNNANENSIVELKSVAIENENLKVTDFNYEDETFDDDFELSFTNNDYITQSIINPIGDVFDKSIVQDEVSFIDELIEEEIVQEIETEPEIQIKQVDSHIIEPVNDDFIEIEHQVVINQQESSFDLNVVINKQESSFDLNENNKSMNTEQSDSDSISINSIENQTIDQIPSINNDVETEQIIIIENDNHKDNDNFSPSIVEGIDESEDEEILIDEEFLAATDELKSLNLVEFGDSLNQASIAHEVSTEIIQGFNDYSKVISEPEIAKKEPVLAVDLAEITEPFVLSDSIIIAAPKTEEIEINSSDTEKIPDFVNDSDDSLQSSPQSYNNPISENLIETLLADMIKSEVEFMIKLKPTPKKIVSVESIVNISDQILEDLSIQMFNQVNMEIKLRNIDVPDELLAPEATRNEARISTANTIGRTSTVEIRDVWKGWGSITILIDLFMSTFSTEQVSQTEPPLIPASIMQTDKFKQEKAEDDFLYSQRLLVFEAINEAIGIVYKDRKYGEVLDFQKVKDRAIAMIKEWSDYPVVHRENLDELLIKEVREEEKLWARLEFEQIEVVDMLVEQVFAREILKF